MTHAHTAIDPVRLRTLAAQGRLWLCEMMAWLCEIFGHGRIGKAMRAQVLQDLHDLRGGLAAILALLALHRLTANPPPPGPPRALRPPNAPTGFRRGRLCAPLRAALRLIKPGRCLHGRVAALARVLDDLDAWVARMARRLEAYMPVAACVMVRAPAQTLAPHARPAPAIADSS